MTFFFNLYITDIMRCSELVCDKKSVISGWPLAAIKLLLFKEFWVENY